MPKEVKATDVDDFYKDGQFLRRWEFVGGRAVCPYDSYPVSELSTEQVAFQVKKNAEVRSRCKRIDALEECVLLHCTKWLAPDFIRAIHMGSVDAIPPDMAALIRTALTETMRDYELRRVGDHDLIDDRSFFESGHDGSYLTHFTSSSAALQSILLNGLLYMPQKRELISSLLPSIAADEALCRGMISLFEGLPEESKHQTFGQFGICLRKLWAERRGAAKVIYIAETGPVSSILRSLLSDNLPQLLKEHPTASINPLLLAEGDQLEAFGASETFRRLMAFYDYVQHVKHFAEREWRIMSPRRQGRLFFLESGKSDLIERKITYVQDKGVSEISKMSHRLVLPREAVGALIAPVSEIYGLREAIRGTEFEGLPILPFEE